MLGKDTTILVNIFEQGVTLLFNNLMILVYLKDK